MKVIAGRVVLSKTVEIVSAALPSKDFGDATSGIMLEVKEDKPKELIMTANSLETFIRMKTVLTEAAEPGVVVPAGSMFSKLVMGLKNLKNPIVIDYDDDENKLNVECGKEYNGSLAHYDSMGFLEPPTDEEIEEFHKMSVPVRLIKKALTEVAFSAGKDKSRLFMTGIYFDQNKDGMNIIGTDAMRMSIIQFKSKIKEPKSVIMPIASLELLRKILAVAEVDDSSIINFYIDDDHNMAYFVHDVISFGFQTYGSDYISEGYDGFMISREDCEIRLRVNREAFLEKLALACAHNASNSDPIMFEVATAKSGALKNREGSITNPSIFSVPYQINKIIGEAKKVSICVIPSFFIDALNRIPEKEVEIGLVDRKMGPVVIFSNEDTNVNGMFHHVFSLAD